MIAALLESQPRARSCREIGVNRHHQSVVSPNEITLKRGELVTLRITSTERVRSFRSKELRFNVELRPNQPREITVSPDKTGRFVVTGSTPGDFELVINVEEAS